PRADAANDGRRNARDLALATDRAAVWCKRSAQRQRRARPERGRYSSCVPSGRAAFRGWNSISGTEGMDKSTVVTDRACAEESFVAVRRSAAAACAFAVACAFVLALGAWKTGRL